MLLIIGQTPPAHAGAVVIEVLGENGHPVPDVVVFIDQQGVAASTAVTETAVMDQIDTRFVPHMLVVRRGTSVEFPNSDVVAHHVYSFSKPNNFVLPLYKGNAHDPIVFSHDGVVTLGCNIHDQMLGYIIVVDTAVFGTTDASGQVELEVDDAAAGYTVNIWNPRIRDEAAALTQDLAVPVHRSTVVSFKLHKKLRAPHHSETDGVQWTEY
ncbi:MAG: methylamine utilization protein [Woeseiaceae bacterium]